MNTLFDDLNDKPFTFSNDNRNENKFSSYRQPYAVKFPYEQGASSHGTVFITSADVAKRLKMLFPDIENFGEKFNQNLYSIVNSRIGRIVNQPPVANNNNNYYSINRYSPSTQKQQYFGGVSNYNNNYQHKQQETDRRHLVYVTNSRGQTEYVLNELTGEKTYL